MGSRKMTTGGDPKTGCCVLPVTTSMNTPIVYDDSTPKYVRSKVWHAAIRISTTPTRIDSAVTPNALRAPWRQVTHMTTPVRSWPTVQHTMPDVVPVDRRYCTRTTVAMVWAMTSMMPSGKSIPTDSTFSGDMANIARQTSPNMIPLGYTSGRMYQPSRAGTIGRPIRGLHAANSMDKIDIEIQYAAT